MPERKYTVVGSHTVLGHAPGDTFSYSFAPDREAFYLAAGHLKAGAEKPEPLSCEACQAHGTAAEKKATYKNLHELREHYGKEHPALAAPTE